MKQEGHLAFHITNFVIRDFILGPAKFVTRKKNQMKCKHPDKRGWVKHNNDEPHKIGKDTSSLDNVR